MRTTSEFQQDPLQFLDQAFPAAGEAIWLPHRQLCLADATVARAVLSNADGLYEDHSDFFHTRRGLFGPRSRQIEIGRAAMMLLNAHLKTHAAELAGRIERDLMPASEWPDAGNWLMYRHFASALVGPGRSARLRSTVDQIVERSVLAGARQRHSRISRGLFRFRAMRELKAAVGQTREQKGEKPEDVLAAVVLAAGSDVVAAELAEIFLSFVFAIAGSVGFTLGWSLYLLGTHPETEAEPAWVVREALRLWPVAWLLARRPARPHRVADFEVSPEDAVIVCPYAVHRNPRHWDDPHRFRPERWGEDHDSGAFIPFGWGPHRCVAASLSMGLVADILQLLRKRYELALTPRGTRPPIGAALAPPHFTLELRPKRQASAEQK